MCPADDGAILARRQAATDPARVLATVVSTRPESTVATKTAIGFGRVSNLNPAYKAMTTATMMMARRLRDMVMAMKIKELYNKPRSAKEIGCALPATMK